MADACRITATRGRRRLSATAAPDAAYVRALQAAGWSVTATPLAKPDDLAPEPDTVPVRVREADEVDGW